MSLRRIGLAALVVVTLISSLAVAQSEHATFRDWTDATGQFLAKAKLRAVTENEVYLQKVDGTIFEIAKTELSKADREFVIRFGVRSGKQLAELDTADLLVRIDPQRDAVKVKWKKVDGVLTVETDKALTLLSVPFELDDHYAITVKVRRDHGASNLIMGFVTGLRQAAVHLDHHPNKSAVQAVDGKLANDNPSTVQNDGSLFTNGTIHTVVYRIENGHIHVFIDGMLVFQWKGDPKRLSTPQFLGVTNPRTLYLGSFGGGWSVFALEVTRLETMLLVESRDKLERIIPIAIQLLKDEEYVVFLKTLVEPKTLRQFTSSNDLPKFAKTFGASEGKALLNALKSIKDSQPIVKREDEVVFDLKEKLGEKDQLTLVRIGDYWYIRWK